MTKQTTNKKTGRLQMTCRCGVVSYPHRVDSVKGCAEQRENNVRAERIAEREYTEYVIEVHSCR